MSVSAENKCEVIRLAMQVHEKCKFFNDVEFKKDVYNIFVIKKMVARFLRMGNINEKLILNNIIIALNTFEIERANEMFKLAMTEEEFGVVKSALLFLDAFTLYDDTTEPNELLIAILLDVAKRYHLGDRYVNQSNI